VDPDDADATVEKDYEKFTIVGTAVGKNGQTSI